MNRRHLLRLGLYTAATAAASPRKPEHAADSAEAPHLESFVDPLPIPVVIRADRSHAPVEIHMRQFRQKVHRDLPPTTLWGYNGAWPGPTLEARRGQTLSVKWANALPAKHLLQIDPTIHGAEEGVPPVRTTVHVHGARVLPESDGYPDAWYTAQGKTGPDFHPGPNRYPNDQPAALLFYHDHAIGITRLNIYAGLSGFYIIRDEKEEALNLPGGAYEIPLLIQDRTFHADGSLFYPTGQHGTHPYWVQEFLGETICVNGKAAPFLEVEPRKYRLRIANGSNSRYYHLTMDVLGDKPSAGPPFHQIGTDGGLLSAPVTLPDLTIGPGERMDVIVDFAPHKGQRVALRNDAPAPYLRGGMVVPPDVLLFKVVKPLVDKDTSTIPETLAEVPLLNPDDADRERLLGITEQDRSTDGYTIIGLLGGKYWSDPVTENPVANSTEIWSFANATTDVHPMHIHLVRFQVINRQPFDAKAYVYTGKVVLTGAPEDPEPNERRAWKDTVRAYPGSITRVIQKFELPVGAPVPPGKEYRYVWHCHMLEHEDNEMMRPYSVIAPPMGRK